MDEIKINLLHKLKEKTNNADRTKDAGIINSNNGSEVMTAGNGDVIVAASKTVQYKMRKSQGAATEISITSNTITNKKNLVADDIVINNHKINPKLYELTNMVELGEDENSAIGNLTMSSYVLVKAWEPFLQKWVLIRRPSRMPMFSNLLNVAGAISETSVDDNITQEINEIENKKQVTI